jgi:hypothetical protein
MSGFLEEHDNSVVKMQRSERRQQALTKKRAAFEDREASSQGKLSHVKHAGKVLGAKDKAVSHRSTRTLTRTCLANSSVELSIDVPAVRPGHAGRWIKWVRKPSAARMSKYVMGAVAMQDSVEIGEEVLQVLSLVPTTIDARAVIASYVLEKADQALPEARSALAGWLWKELKLDQPDGALTLATAAEETRNLEAPASTNEFAIAQQPGHHHDSMENEYLSEKMGRARTRELKIYKKRAAYRERIAEAKASKASTKQPVRKDVVKPHRAARVAKRTSLANSSIEHSVDVPAVCPGTAGKWVRWIRKPYVSPCAKYLHLQVSSAVQSQAAESVLSSAPGAYEHVGEVVHDATKTDSEEVATQNAFDSKDLVDAKKDFGMDDSDAATEAPDSAVPSVSSTPETSPALQCSGEPTMSWEDELQPLPTSVTSPVMQYCAEPSLPSEDLKALKEIDDNLPRDRSSEAESPTMPASSTMQIDTAALLAKDVGAEKQENTELCSQEKLASEVETRKAIMRNLLHWQQEAHEEELQKLRMKLKEAEEQRESMAAAAADASAQKPRTAEVSSKISKAAALRIGREIEKRQAAEAQKARQASARLEEMRAAAAAKVGEAARLREEAEAEAAALAAQALAGATANAEKIAEACVKHAELEAQAMQEAALQEASEKANAMMRKAAEDAQILCAAAEKEVDTLKENLSSKSVELELLAVRVDTEKLGLEKRKAVMRDVLQAQQEAHNAQVQELTAKLAAEQEAHKSKVVETEVNERKRKIQDCETKISKLKLGQQLERQAAMECKKQRQSAARLQEMRNKAEAQMQEAMRRREVAEAQMQEVTRKREETEAEMEAARGRLFAEKERAHKEVRDAEGRATAIVEEAQKAAQEMCKPTESDLGEVEESPEQTSPAAEAQTFAMVEEGLSEELVAPEASADLDEDFMEWCLSGTVMTQAESEGEGDDEDDAVSWTVLA